MKREPSDIEKDPVWELLRESSAQRPSPSFAANVVRAARLEGQAKPWWKTWLIPATAGATLAGAAALVAVVISFQAGSPTGSNRPVANREAPSASLADLQDTVETEVFLAASDHLGDYTDDELVSMIGF
ncbi:hypothetical protein [Luteolibacter sp. Populi]|uniref:hypothetical protein n=1 Tax=Luteolibacter sp. Populi TaxID=3230487 RepID=UPI003465FE39